MHPVPRNRQGQTYEVTQEKYLGGGGPFTAAFSPQHDGLQRGAVSGGSSKCLIRRCDTGSANRDGCRHHPSSHRASRYPRSIPQVQVPYLMRLIMHSRLATVGRVNAASATMRSPHLVDLSVFRCLIDSPSLGEFRGDRVDYVRTDPIECASIVVTIPPVRPQ